MWPNRKTRQSLFCLSLWLYLVSLLGFQIFPGAQNFTTSINLSAAPELFAEKNLISARAADVTKNSVELSLNWPILKLENSEKNAEPSISRTDPCSLSVSTVGDDTWNQTFIRQSRL